MWSLSTILGSPISYVVEAVNEDTGVLETFSFDAAPFYLPITEVRLYIYVRNL